MSRKYPREFRELMVELVRSGRSPEALEKEFDPTAKTIRNWLSQADRGEGSPADGVTTDEREELSRLRRENRQLKLERDIMSKAAAWLARESVAVPLWFATVLPRRRIVWLDRSLELGA